MKRTCRYFNTAAGCSLGTQCPFLHTDPAALPSGVSASAQLPAAPAGGAPPSIAGLAGTVPLLKPDDDGADGRPHDVRPGSGASQKVQPPKAATTLCNSFTFRGFCLLGRDCPFVHAGGTVTEAGVVPSGVVTQSATAAAAPAGALPTVPSVGSGAGPASAAASAASVAPSAARSEVLPAPPSLTLPPAPPASLPRPPVFSTPAGRAAGVFHHPDSAPHHPTTTTYMPAGTPYDAEFAQVARRYPSFRVVQVGPPTIVSVSFAPSDPDFPFDVPLVHVHITMPLTYPAKACVMRVTNLDIPERIRARIDDALARRAAALSGQIMIRPLLTYLDNRLEELLTGRAEGPLVPVTAIRAPAHAAADDAAAQAALGAQLAASRLDSDPEDGTGAGAAAAGDGLEAAGQHGGTGAEVRPAHTADGGARDGATAAATAEDDAAAAAVAARSRTEAQSHGTRLTLRGLHLEGIGVLLCVHAALTLSCDRCRQRVDVTLGRDARQALSCERCHVHLAATWHPDQMHAHSARLGHVLLQGASVVDLLPSDFRASCLGCSAETSVRSLQRGTDVHRVCRTCFAKMALRFDAVDIAVLTPAAPATSGEAAAAAAAAPAARTRRGEHDGVIRPGQPLPDNGTCKHYRRSFRWFRFACCGKAFPCDRCHHEAHPEAGEQLAPRWICGYCSTEQPISQSECRSCGGRPVARTGGKSHWEGGKGCRNPTLLSVNDSHKYAGMGKTISKKHKRPPAGGKKDT